MMRFAEDYAGKNGYTSIRLDALAGIRFRSDYMTHWVIGVAALSRASRRLLLL